MPRSPREINDRLTESRLREVVQSILRQEIRRLNNSTVDLSGQVDDNTTNISINSANIDINQADICNLERRQYDHIGSGIVRSSQLVGTGAGADVTVTAIVAEQVWSIQVSQQPIQVTLWNRDSFTTDALFDTFQFDQVLFDQAEEVLSVTTAPTVTWLPASGTFSIDWSVSKTGTLYLISFGGKANSIVAVAD